MSVASTPAVMDRLLDPLTRCLTPEVARSIAESGIDPDVQRRLDELADKANRGTLTAAEHQEYAEYVEAIDLVGLIQTKARSLLQTQAK